MNLSAFIYFTRLKKNVSHLQLQMTLCCLSDSSDLQSHFVWWLHNWNVTSYHVITVILQVGEIFSLYL